MTAVKGVVLLVGCAELSEAVEAEGYRAHVAEYFWGCTEPVPLMCRAALVSTDVGGGTGLAVAERLLERRIVPVVLYRRSERYRVVPRFHGLEWSRGDVPAHLGDLLRRCARMTAALAIDAPTTEMRVRTSMIVRIDSTGS